MKRTEQKRMQGYRPQNNRTRKFTDPWIQIRTFVLTYYSLITPPSKYVWYDFVLSLLCERSSVMGLYQRKDWVIKLVPKKHNLCIFCTFLALTV
jgi:hypothetical protein